MAETKSKRSGSRSGSRSKSGSGSKSGSSSKSGSGSQSRSRSTGGSGSKSGSGSKTRGGSSRRSSAKNRPMRDVVIDAVTQAQELIGRPVESVTGVERNGSEWTVKVEVVELERIPNTTDVLGVYDITLDKDGELTSARRTKRYYRSEAGED
jgi:Gas vesicle synthesis protein GvpO